jgi:N-acylneuraminate cytidylyltransferase
MKDFIYAFIFARGGSKGIPRKNIKLLGDKPLIAHAIETGLNSRYINRVAVSTDDKEIAEVARTYGADVPFMRPKYLAQDDSPELLAWRHAVTEIKKTSDRPNIDIFVSIPPTAPFRSVEDVDACILTYMESDADVVVTIKKASRHPSFNMVTLDENGYAHLVMPVKDRIHRRQDASNVYDMTTVAYVSKPEFILNADSIFDGKVLGVVIPEERALDIDTALDFEFAEFLANRSSEFKKTC